MMNINAAFAGAALMLGFVPQTFAQTALESLPLKEICIKDLAGDGYVVDLDKAACAAMGVEDLCKGDPQFTATIRSKYFTLTTESKRNFDRLSWKRILAGSNDRFKPRRLPGCTNGRLQHDDLARTDCVRISCETFSGSTAEASGDPSPLGKLRVRLNAGELWKGDFKKAAPADISLLRDFDSGGNTFSVRGAIGYPFSYDTAGEGNNPLQFIPYAAIERVESRNLADVTNLSAGTRLTYDYFPTGTETGWAHFFDAGINLLTDEEADSLVLDGSLTYTPLPNVRLFRSGLRSDPLRLRAETSAMFELGEVFDSGTRTVLVTTDNYLRAGGQIQLVLDAVTDDPALEFLERFDVRVKYKYLYGFEGPTDALEQFEASLNYALTASGNFGFQLKYFDGQLDTTLEDREYFLGALTVRF